MSSALQVAMLAAVAATLVVALALPFIRPPAGLEADDAVAARDAERARLFAALAELAADRKAGMISQADYAAAVADVRRRLARL